MNVIQEAYVNDISTRKIDKLTKFLDIESILRKQVSIIIKELNEQVDIFRNYQLDFTYLVRWVDIDTLYKRVILTQRVKNIAAIMIPGITCGETGYLAVKPMGEESVATYTYVFNKLKIRFKLRIILFFTKKFVFKHQTRDCQVKCVNYFKLKPDIFVPWCQSVRQ
jgi:transposase-like protein